MAKIVNSFGILRYYWEPMCTNCLRSQRRLVTTSTTCWSRFLHKRESPLVSLLFKTRQTATLSPVVQRVNYISSTGVVRKPKPRLPDELWVLLLVGVGGVVLYGFTQMKKHEISVKKGTQLHEKLAKAKIAEEADKRPEAYLVLKDALELIHKEISDETDGNKKQTESGGRSGDHPALQYVLCKLGSLAFDLEKWPQAEHYYRLALRHVLASGTPKEDEAVIEMSLKLSKACAFQNKNKAAREGFKWCIKMAEKNLAQTESPSDNSKALLGVCLDGYGSFLSSQGESEEAVKVLRKALNISKEVLGKDHEQTLVVMNNLASVCADCERYEEAEKIASKVVTIAEENDDSNLPAFLANYGDILQHEGKLKKAKKVLIRALKLAEAAEDEETIKMIEGNLMQLEINVN